MIVQYAIVATAVLVALIYLARSLASSWRTGGCESGSCSGCGQSQAAACTKPERLVQLGIPSRRNASDRHPPGKPFEPS